MLPNLIVIGAMKSGTSSLHSYLNLHPQISMSHPKELDFFVLEKNWSKGIGWYESHFVDGARFNGESSPNYTKCHLFGGVPSRMHSIVPEAKLIYLLRDPIERIISHYVHNVAARSENRSFTDSLRANENYILSSKYYMQLEKYIEYFPKSNILVLTSEDLYKRRQQTLQTTFRFLGLDDDFYSQGFTDILHQSSVKKRRTGIGLLLAKLPGRKAIKALSPSRSHLADIYHSWSRREVKRPALSEKLRQELMDALEDDIKLLRRYTGNGFEQWCM
jgi:hypothetical protein